jgi:hypothetical protein
MDAVANRGECVTIESRIKKPMIHRQRVCGERRAFRARGTVVMPLLLGLDDRAAMPSVERVDG